MVALVGRSAFSHARRALVMAGSLLPALLAAAHGAGSAVIADAGVAALFGGISLIGGYGRAALPESGTLAVPASA
jgi:hypothetical protein